ncbi:MAG: glycosyltransferase [Cyanobium sp.]
MALAAARILLIVPTRDSLPLLPRLVDSLLQQSFGAWEVCFIDASTSPDTPAWLDNLCRQDSRFRWQPQQSSRTGIFGAMNQGFAAASPDDWLLFWGSDDWAASPTVLAEVLALLERARQQDAEPDLLIGSGRYVGLEGAAASRPGRRSAMGWWHSYRVSMLLGSTPPHQATLIGPGARRHLAHYREAFRLAADLDYFLRLCRWPGLRVLLTPLDLVHMGEGGVSSRQTTRRLAEVRRAYGEAFGLLWPLPFLARYGQRLASRWMAPGALP